MRWRVILVAACVCVVISGCSVLKQNSSDVHNAYITTLDDLREEHMQAAYAEYEGSIGVTVPGERIVECVESGIGRDYSVYEFSDDGFIHAFYLFAFSLTDYESNKRKCEEDLDVNKDTIYCDDAFRVVYYERNITTLGNNGYNFIRESIMNKYEAVAAERGINVSEVDAVVDEIGRKVSIIGELSEWNQPVPELETDSDGFILAPTDERFFKYKKLLDGTVAVTEYSGSGGTRLVFPDNLGGKTVSEIRQLEPAEGIVSVVIPPSVKKLSNSFKGWAELQQLVLQDGLEEIDAETIKDTSITQVEFPSTLRVLGEGFYANSNLTSYDVPVLIKDTSGLFCDLSIETFIVPGTVETVGENTFQDCKMLETVFIEEGVKHIKADAFKGCNALQAVAIPSSVEYIDVNAFRGCQPVLIVQPGTYAQGYAIRNECEYANP